MNSTDLPSPEIPGPPHAGRPRFNWWMFVAVLLAPTLLTALCVLLFDKKGDTAPVIAVFGGGLALYNAAGHVVGGLGVSGDTSCADHNIAYRTRSTLNLDYVPAGVAAALDPTRRDNIIFDITPQGGGDAAPGLGQMPGVSSSGFGHASCHGYHTAGNGISAGFAATLPPNK